jgi:hypothetical protein
VGYNGDRALSTYVIVDLQNLAMRVRYGVRAPDFNAQVGLAMHIIFASIKKVWNDFNATHLVCCLESRSWRRDFYPAYKAHRRVASSQRSVAEVEEDRVFFEALDDFIKFVSTRTNATLLKAPQAEADDLIARWIQLHPGDEHVIVSTDSDFQQLLAPNVKIYDGISALLYTIEGIYDKDGHLANNKRGEPLPLPHPEWLLFEKCIRGDASDNVMSAYPGVRKKRMQEAFENRHSQGYSWNNLMLSTWIDHNGDEIRVRDAYERNRILIDLTSQPKELVEIWDTCIKTSANQPAKSQIGIALLKFAAQWGLVRIEKTASDYSVCFSSSYSGVLKV